MQSYLHAMSETFSKLDTSELVVKVSTGGLTEEAHQIALAELKKRQVDISKFPSGPVSEYSSAPQLWKLSPEERDDRKLRLIGTFSICLLLLWVVGCSLIAMEVANKKGGLGVATGWLTFFVLATLPVLYSWRAFRKVGRSESTRQFIGRQAYIYWGLSFAGSAAMAVFALVGVVTEAMKP